MKKLIVTMGLLAVLGVGAMAFVIHNVNDFMNTAMDIPEDGLEFQIESGSSFTAVTQKLKAAGAIDDDRWMRLYARWHKLGGGIHAGDYLIASGATPLVALEQFSNGSVRLYTFTIIEGWNHRDLLAAMHANDAIDATMSDEDWPALLESLGSDTLYPEGLFLPETYRFPKDTSDRELLAQAYDLMQTTLAEEWPERSPETPVNSPYEALILASIVEKETALADERAKIAGVFKRRLAKRMRLQTDPTVIYGIGPAFDGNLTRKHLRTDTPYNTYTRHGLPPTPIAMVGRAAIHAALHPEAGSELFFVATGLGDGSHKFSDTKDEHDAAVAEYLTRLRQQRRQGR